MAAPLVSVCIPCHNAADYVGLALESILAQSWPAIEIIVVNDGSTDGSAAVLNRHRSSRVKVISKTFRSAAISRNHAYALAQGEYIKFFDADDLLSPESIARQMMRLDARSDAVASSEWGRFHGDDLATFKLNQQKVWRDMAADEWLVEAWKDARPMTQPGMFLIPRALMEKAGGWQESLTLIDDFEFFARVLCQAKDVLFTAHATLYYRSSLANSLSGQKSREAMESACRSLLMGTGHLLRRRCDPAARLSCANMLQEFIYGTYPDHPDLIRMVRQRIKELGGSNLAISGGPRFHQLRRLVGWKAAKRLHKLAGRS